MATVYARCVWLLLLLRSSERAGSQAVWPRWKEVAACFFMCLAHCSTYVLRPLFAVVRRAMRGARGLSSCFMSSGFMSVCWWCSEWVFVGGWWFCDERSAGFCLVSTLIGGGGVLIENGAVPPSPGEGGAARRVVLRMFPATTAQMEW